MQIVALLIKLTLIIVNAYSSHGKLRAADTARLKDGLEVALNVLQEIIEVKRIAAAKFDSRRGVPDTSDPYLRD